ncbi:MAG: hypothetical protein AAB470_00010 [Patescibacteria group bacterium]
MEDFRKLVYKDPELQSKNEEVSTPEQVERSEAVAREKLEKISNPDFKAFSVRYVNAVCKYRRIQTYSSDWGVLWPSYITWSV